MNVHSLAKSTPLSRLELIRRVVEERWSMRQATAAAGVSVSLGYRWLRRYRLCGPAGVGHRSSAPLHQPTRLHRSLIRQIGCLRCYGRTISYIAASLSLTRSLVGRWVARLGLSKVPRQREPVRRYEMSAPGELVHIDVKKLRGFSWAGRKFIEDSGRRQRGAQRQYMHVAVDGYSRFAYAEILDRENGAACIGFVQRAREQLKKQGIEVQRILTDNASAYRGKQLAAALRELGVAHSFTRVRRPQTNGKAERFIRTAMMEWGYLRFENSGLRDAALPAWLEYYNHRRTHCAIGHKPPASRL